MSTDLSTTNETNEQGLRVFEQERFKAIEQFTHILNEKPKDSELQSTFDKKAKTLPISFIETKLDEVYLRQWGTRDQQVIHIANELLVTLTLWVIDPQTGREITRCGFAAVSMQWDAVPEALQWKDGEPLQNKRDRNAWNMDLQNKKQESLKLPFPKAKAMAIKNAAQSLGKAFGRDINRKHEDTPGDFYTDLMEGNEMLAEAKDLILKARTKPDFDTIWSSYPDLHEDERFKKEFLYYHRKYVK